MKKAFDLDVRPFTLKSSKVLIIDDDSAVTTSLEAQLLLENFEVFVSNDAREGLELVNALDLDVIILDLLMGSVDGIDLVHALNLCKPKLPVILVSDRAMLDMAIRQTKGRAYDYLLKPFTTLELLEILNKAVISYRMASIPVKLGDNEPEYEALIGASREMQLVYKDIIRFSKKPVAVLLQGELGTGKELVARALYQHSSRAGEPFIAVSGSTIQNSLIESELFGHEQNAFVGAGMKRIGRFEQAHLGTLFLHEVDALPLHVQVELVRVIREKSIRRVGSRKTIPIDVRLIVAAHINLEDAVSRNEFSKALYSELKQAVITLPPLRERVEDILLLTKFFIRRWIEELGLQSTGIKSEGISYLETQQWPGNVTQLENVIRNALLECEGQVISAAVLSRILGGRASLTPDFVSTRTDAVLTDVDGIVRSMLNQVKANELDSAIEPLTDLLEESLYRQAIEIAGGNQAKAARWVGVSRLTMREKLQKFGLHPGKT